MLVRYVTEKRKMMVVVERCEVCTLRVEAALFLSCCAVCIWRVQELRTELFRDRRAATALLYTATLYGGVVYSSLQCCL